MRLYAFPSSFFTQHYMSRITFFFFRTSPGDKRQKVIIFVPNSASDVTRWIVKCIGLPKKNIYPTPPPNSRFPLLHCAENFSQFADAFLVDAHLFRVFSSFYCVKSAGEQQLAIAGQGLIIAKNVVRQK